MVIQRHHARKRCVLWLTGSSIPEMVVLLGWHLDEQISQIVNVPTNSSVNLLHSFSIPPYFYKYPYNHLSTLPPSPVGGLKRAGGWVWYRRGARHQTPVNYTAWAPNHPASYSTLTLVRYDGSPPRFVWRGAWAGSEKQLPKFSHSYICEAKAKGE